MKAVSKYSKEEVLAQAAYEKDKLRLQDMLISYALILEKIERSCDELTNIEIMKEWFIADGGIHGPNIESVTMPRAKYLAFRRSLQAIAHLLPSEHGRVDAEAKVNMHATLAMQDAGTEVLWNRQFQGSPWAGQFHLINKASLGELNKVSCDVYFAMRRVELDADHPPAQATQVDEATTKAIIESVHAGDGMDGDSWDRLLVRAALGYRQPSAQVGRSNKAVGPKAYSYRDCAEEAARTTAEPVAKDDDDQAWDDNAERLTRAAGIGGAGINPNATSMDDIFLPTAKSDDGSVVLIRRLRGRAAFLRGRGHVKSPQLMEQAAAELEAAQSRAVPYGWVLVPIETIKSWRKASHMPSQLWWIRDEMSKIADAPQPGEPQP